jgi:hypothetical protein
VGVVSSSRGAAGPPQSQWPEGRLDAIARLRVVETAVRGLGTAERTIEAPYQQVWDFVSDLEHAVPAFDSLVRKMRVRGRTPLRGGGERLDVLSWSTGSPVALPFDVHMEDGLCLMRARGRLFFVGMAAVPEGPGRTRFRHVEGVPLPGGRLLRPVFRRTSRSDLGHLARLSSEQASG